MKDNAGNGDNAPKNDHGIKKKKKKNRKRMGLIRYRNVRDPQSGVIKTVKGVNISREAKMFEKLRLETQSSTVSLTTTVTSPPPQQSNDALQQFSTVQPTPPNNPNSSSSPMNIDGTTDTDALFSSHLENDVPEVHLLDDEDIPMTDVNDNHEDVSFDNSFPTASSPEATQSMDLDEVQTEESVVQTAQSVVCNSMKNVLSSHYEDVELLLKGQEKMNSELQKSIGEMQNCLYTEMTPAKIECWVQNPVKVIALGQGIVESGTNLFNFVGSCCNVSLNDAANAFYGSQTTVSSSSDKTNTSEPPQQGNNCQFRQQRNDSEVTEQVDTSQQTNNDSELPQQTNNSQTNKETNTAHPPLQINNSEPERIDSSANPKKRKARQNDFQKNEKNEEEFEKIHQFLKKYEKPLGLCGEQRKKTECKQLFEILDNYLQTVHQISAQDFFCYSLKGNEEGFKILDELFFSPKKTRKNQSKDAVNLSDKFQKKFNIKTSCNFDVLSGFDRSKMSYEDYQGFQQPNSILLPGKSTLGGIMSKVNAELECFFEVHEIERKEENFRGVYGNLYKIVKTFQNTRKFHGKAYKISFDSKEIDGYGDYLVCTVSKILLKGSQSPENYVICGIFDAAENSKTYKCIGALFDKEIDKLQKEGFIFYQVSDMKSWRCCSAQYAACPMCQHQRADFYTVMEKEIHRIRKEKEEEKTKNTQSTQETNSTPPPQETNITHLPQQNNPIISETSATENEKTKYKEELKEFENRFKVCRAIGDVFPSIPIERKLPCILHSTQRMTEKFLTKIICVQDWVKNKEDARLYFKKFGISINFITPKQKEKKAEEVTTVALETQKFEVGMMKYTRLLFFFFKKNIPKILNCIIFFI